MFRIISHILLNTSGQGKKEIASLIKKKNVIKEKL